MKLIVAIGAWVEVSADYGVAIPEQRFADGTADTPGGSGHDGNLSRHNN
jgi:hypothetical protein